MDAKGLVCQAVPFSPCLVTVCFRRRNLRLIALNAPPICPQTSAQTGGEHIGHRHHEQDRVGISSG